MKPAFVFLAVLSALSGCAPSRDTGTASGGTAGTGGGPVPVSGGTSGPSSSGNGGMGNSGGAGQATSSVPSVGAGGGAAPNSGAGGVSGLGGTTAKGPGQGGSPGSSGGSSTAVKPGSGGTAGASSSSVGSGGAGGSPSSGTGPVGPCDIYQNATPPTPCGAAHSTVRALYSSYGGPLYQVQRASDQQTKDITVGPGGFANSADQDSFCSGTTCTIPIIYDQSPNGNHLRVTWFSNWLPKGAIAANATDAKITVGGHTVYGIKHESATNSGVGYRTGTQLPGTASVTKGSTTVTFTDPQTLAANVPLMFVAELPSCSTYNCPMFLTAAAITAATTVTLQTAYSGPSSSSTVVWNENTTGVATGDAAESMYSVFDAKVFGQWCCFDYGSAEMDGVDDGSATMEAISWAADTQFGQSGGGNGPWVGADLENGMYEGYENGSAKVASNTS
ncbi:MAG: arabinofuranosidase catalytic domain-containing protein, partial [Polyangia bacterium]